MSRQSPADAATMSKRQGRGAGQLSRAAEPLTRRASLRCASRGGLAARGEASFPGVCKSSILPSIQTVG